MEDFHLRSSLLEDDGLPLVIDLLQSEYAIIQEFALKTLRSCMHHGSKYLHTVILLSPSLPSLLQLPPETQSLEEKTYLN